MKITKLNSDEAGQILRDLERRRSEASTSAFEVADAAIAGVRDRGDKFVAEQIAKYDLRTIAPDEILFSLAETGEAAAGARGKAEPAIGRELVAAIDVAIQRIEAFHRAQLPESYCWSIGDTTVEHRVRPIRRIGIYVPGGRAVYVSTLIMCAVPARIAGVDEIVVATTPAAAERPELLYVARKLGVRQIYRSGGAAAIAALALGTGSLAPVDKIVGPGNAYVTAAKARLIGRVGIDMTAGPTELVVIADETAVPEFIAADLLAQAEHGADSAVICIATSDSVARAIAAIVDETEPIAGRSGPVFIFVTDALEEAVALANRIAPEHLSIQTREPQLVARMAENCGAIYAGPSAAPAAGDYIIGPNHVLPTAGSARFFSPLGVYDFVKRTNVVTTGRSDAEQIAPLADALARFEGLPMHAASVMARTNVAAGERRRA